MLARYQPISWLFTLLLALSLATVAHAQLNEHCTVSQVGRVARAEMIGAQSAPYIKT